MRVEILQLPSTLPTTLDPQVRNYFQSYTSNLQYFSDQVTRDLNTLASSTPDGGLTAQQVVFGGTSGGIAQDPSFVFQTWSGAMGLELATTGTSVNFCGNINVAGDWMPVDPTKPGFDFYFAFDKRHYEWDYVMPATDTGTGTARWYRLATLGIPYPQGNADIEFSVGWPVPWGLYVDSLGRWADQTFNLDIEGTWNLLNPSSAGFDLSFNAQIPAFGFSVIPAGPAPQTWVTPVRIGVNGIQYNTLAPNYVAFKWTGANCELWVDNIRIGTLSVSP